MEWWRDQAPKHQLFVSAEVVPELSDPSFPQRDEALALVQGLGLLDLTPEVRAFASLLVQSR